MLVKGANGNNHGEGNSVDFLRLQIYNYSIVVWHDKCLLAYVLEPLVSSRREKLMQEHIDIWGRV